MNNILFRYVLKQFALTFFAALFILTTVIMMFDMIELLRLASKEENVTLGNVILLTILKSPQMVHIILPFITLIAGLIFLFKFDKSSELVVMRSAGLSAWNITCPIILFIGIIGILDTTVFNPITAFMSTRYERLEEKLGMSDATPLVKSDDGFWLREVQSERTLVIRTERVRQKDKQVILENVAVFELDEENHFKRQNEAEAGVLDNGILTLTNPFVIDPEQETGKVYPKKTFETDLSLERILEKFDDPRTMSFWRFPRFIKSLQESGFSTVVHEMYWHELWAFPATLIAMILISIVFAIPPTSRQGKVLMRVLIAVISGFLLYFMTRITHVMGQSGSLPMILAAWGPALIVIPLCLSALLHTEDG